MATVTDSIRDAIWYYPTLQSHRAAALHWMFTSSNYAWENGELVYCTDYAAEEARRPHHSDPHAHFTHQVDTWLDHQVHAYFSHLDRTGSADGFAWETLNDLDWWRQNAVQEAALVKHVRANIDALTSTRSELLRVGGLYKPSETYGGTGDTLWQLPSDATEEWLDAAEEFCLIVADAPHSGYYVENDHLLSAAAEIDWEQSDREAVVFAEIMGTEPSSREQRAAWHAEYQTERHARIRADVNTTLRNREIAAELLDRIARIRADRRSARPA